MSHTFLPSKTYEEALDRAARLWGIEPEYHDTWGRRHVTTPGIERAILEARGLAAGTREELDAAVEQRLAEEWARLLPPVFVAGESAWPKGFPVNVPAEQAEGRAALEIRWEDGEVERRDLPLEGMARVGEMELRGARYVRKQVPLGGRARLGYHDVELTLGRQRAAMRLILCPDRAYTAPPIGDGGRTAGLALALYGLRSNRNWGSGDLTDLEGVLDWTAAELGVSFIGLNPLHAIANRQPFNTSPYLPMSSFYKNAIYLDLERVEDFRETRRARCWRERPQTQQAIQAARAAAFIEYEQVWKLKLHGLKLAFAGFLRREWRRDTGRAREFKEYVEREGELLDQFAVFCALDEFIHRRQPEVWIWRDWPEEYHDPESGEARAFAKKHWRLVLFYKYAQWQTERQLEAAQQHARERGLSIGLYHDLALATDRCGADFWACRPFFVSGCRVGAPPDTFSPQGQDWSFPPPNTDHHRETGYRLIAEAIRKNCRHGGALRIDHVMRFFRLYWIPEGNAPADGAYVRDYSDDLLHILALESARNQVVVVGEDLGTVTQEIRRALAGFGIYGYRVPQFEKRDDGEIKRPREYADHALVASSTHDLPTLAGLWLFRDIEARRAAGLLPNENDYHRQLEDRRREKQKLLDALFEEGLLPDWVARRAEHLPEFTGELHNALTGWLARAPSRLLALTTEDLFKEIEQQNLPGTTSEYPNWRRRMRYAVEELQGGAARDFTTMFRHWLEWTGRRAG